MIHPGATTPLPPLAANRRALVLGLAGVMLAGCNRAVGNVLPDGSMPAITGVADASGRPVPGFAADEFRRGPAILNIWASWCPDCRAEHDQLMHLAADRRFRMLGLVFRDKPEPVAAYLRRAGNPYAALALDDGRIAKMLGQKGVPYSYVVSGEARILAVVRGTMDDKAVAEIVMPALRIALGTGAA